MSIFLIFLLFPVGVAAEQGVSACKDLVPDTPDFAFSRVILDSNQSRSEISQALGDACRELDTSTWEGKFSQRTHRGLNTTVKVFTPVIDFLSFGSSSFTILGNSEVERRFKAELATIKKIQDPIHRIQATYEMVVKYQGEYDYDNDGNPGGGGLFTSPKDIILKADEQGAGGVCRDFAKLLYWSLQQVQRPEGATSSFNALDTNSFSVSSKMGAGSVDGKGYAHAWLRINLPHRRNGHLEFERFDIDTTWYSKRFTPLLPRHQGWSDQNLSRMQSQCRRVKECVDERQAPQSPPIAPPPQPQPVIVPANAVQ